MPSGRLSGSDTSCTQARFASSVAHRSRCARNSGSVISPPCCGSLGGVSVQGAYRVPIMASTATQSQVDYAQQCFIALAALWASARTALRNDERELAVNDYP